jgi:hypothetical protein
MFCFVVAELRGAMAQFLPIAAQLAISHFDYPTIAPLPQVCWIL